mmetsp:Transcript_8249/g.20774  ORF Transcript_8249/g.20774 Transcript_8249/m.20774 type:complete len:1970 (-) Transcript_8249:116-6025(-)
MTLRMKDALKLPGETTRKHAPSGLLKQLNSGEVLSALSDKQVRQILGKGKWPVYLDLSPPHFQLDNADFLLVAKDVVKEIDLTSNNLRDCTSLRHLTKLRRLILDKNRLESIDLSNLSSLEKLSLADNRLQSIPSMNDLRKLVNLDLSGNQITSGFEQIRKVAKTLRVIDLSRNAINMSLGEFSTYVMDPLKACAKLEYLSLSENEVAATIPRFRLFLVHSLPKIKYINWDVVSSKERTQAEKLAEQGIWKIAPETAVSKLAKKSSSGSRSRISQIRRATGAEEPLRTAPAPGHPTEATEATEAAESPAAAKLNSESGSGSSAENSPRQTVSTPAAAASALSDEDALEAFMNGGDEATLEKAFEAPADGQSVDDFDEILNFLNEGEALGQSTGSAAGGSSEQPASIADLAEDLMADCDVDLMSDLTPSAASAASATSNSGRAAEPKERDEVDALEDLLGMIGDVTDPAITPRDHADSEGHAAGAGGVSSSPSDEFDSLIAAFGAGAPSKATQQQQSSGGAAQQQQRQAASATAPTDVFDELEMLARGGEGEAEHNREKERSPLHYAEEETEDTGSNMFDELEKLTADLNSGQETDSSAGTVVDPFAELERFAAEVGGGGDGAAEKERSSPAPAAAVDETDMMMAELESMLSAAEGDGAGAADSLAAAERAAREAEEERRRREAEELRRAAEEEIRLSLGEANQQESHAPPQRRTVAGVDPQRQAGAAGLALAAQQRATQAATPSAYRSGADVLEAEEERRLDAEEELARAKRAALAEQAQLQAQQQAQQRELAERAREAAEAQARAERERRLLEQRERQEAAATAQSRQMAERAREAAEATRRMEESVRRAEEKRAAAELLRRKQAEAQAQQEREREAEEARERAHQAKLQAQQRQVEEERERLEEERRRLEEQRREVERERERVRREAEERSAQHRAELERLSSQQQLGAQAMLHAQQRSGSVAAGLWGRPQSAHSLQQQSQQSQQTQPQRSAHGGVVRSASLLPQAVVVQTDAGKPARATSEVESMLDLLIADPVNAGAGGVDGLAAEELAALAAVTGGASASPWELSYSELHVEDLLGSGSFGASYRGLYRQREVIVKKLKCQRQDEEFRAAMRAEAPQLAALTHANVVPLIGVTLVGTVCAVSDYVNGTPLYGLLRNRGFDLDLEFVLRVSRQVAEGMCYLHEQRVFHRCLHSRNVIMDHEMRPRITDAGLQTVKEEVVREGGLLAVRTTAPEMFGVPGQLVPPADGPADVYSFGLLLWECFSRETPYHDAVPSTIPLAVRQGLRPMVPPHTPTVLDRLVRGCWTGEPERRPNFAKVLRILNTPQERIEAYDANPVAGAAGSAPLSTREQQAAAAATAVSEQRAQRAASAPRRRHAVVVKIAEMLESPAPRAKVQALKAVCNTGRALSNAEAIRDSDLLPAVLALLEHRDAEVQEHACRALDALCEVDGVSTMVCEQPRACARLVLLLGQTQTQTQTQTPSQPGGGGAGDPAVVLAAARAATRLAMIERVPRLALRDAGAVSALCALLAHPNNAVAQQAVWCVGLLLEESECVDDLRRAGGVPPLAALLAHQSPGVQLRALVALGLLLPHQDLRQQLRSATLVPRFVRLLQSNSALLRKEAAAAIGRSAKAGPELRAEIHQSGGLRTLVALAAEAQAGVAYLPDVLESLLLFAVDDRYRPVLLSLRCMHAAVALLKHPDHAELQSLSLRLLLALCASAEGVSDLRALGGAAPLVGCLTSQVLSVRAAALAALALLARSPAAKSAVQETASVPAVLALLSAPEADTRTQMHAAQVLAALSEVPKHQAAIRQPRCVQALIAALDTDAALSPLSITLANITGDVGARQEIFRLRGMAKLFRTLSSPHCDDVSHQRVLWALCNFSSDKATHAAIVRSGVIPLLASFLEDSTNIALCSLSLKAALQMAAAADPQALAALRLLKPSLNELLRTSGLDPRLHAVAQKVLSML